MGKIRKRNKVKIRTSDVILCNKCDKASKVSDWDLKTFNECTTREMRREFIGLTDARAYQKSSDTWYMCPCCNEYTEGYKLKIEETDGRN